MKQQETIYIRRIGEYGPFCMGLIGILYVEIGNLYGINKQFVWEYRLLYGFDRQFVWGWTSKYSEKWPIFTQKQLVIDRESLI